MNYKISKTMYEYARLLTISDKTSYTLFKVPVDSSELSM